MSTKPALSGRAAKLENLFYSFIKGDRSVQNSQEAKQFFEAVDVVCEHTSAVACIEHIIGKKEGLSTVRVAIRSNLSRAFITTATTAFLKRVLHHDVKTINDGLFLEKLLVEIMSPSTFWTTFLGFYQCNQLEGDTLVAFASLCLEIVSSSSPDIQILSHDVESLMKISPLTKSPLEEVRTLGYRIEKVIQLRKGQATASVKMNYSPGGRHDNDFEDFRKISIFPTADEVSSKEEPFLQRLDDVFEIPRESRTSSYISWLFRLLREDMLADLREDLQIAWGQKKAKYKPLCLGGLSLCREGINFPQNKRSPEAKKKYLEEYKNFVKHGAIGALCLEKDIIAFGSIVRDVNGLIMDHPVVGIQVTDNAGLKLAVKFYVVDTATFSYEPILQRLKEVTEIPIENAILDPAGPPSTYDPPPRLQAFIRELRNCRQKGLGADLGPKLGFKRTIHIQDAQLESLIKGLENPVGQIQGPPGTGKSFIGAIIAKVLMQLTEYRILVLSYTNHALDQFLEDLMDIGIDENNMVRIGSKATSRTDALRIDNLSRIPQGRSSLDIRPMLNATRSEQLDTATRLDNLIQSLKSQVPLQEILDTLEFSDSGMRYWSAFQVPDGDQIAGKKNKALKPVDVFDRWLNGKNLGSLGMLAAHIDPEDYPIWNIPPERRQTLYNEWANQVRQEQIDSLFKESKRNVVKNRRIIGCTTTGAAMYQSIIRAASPDIVLVEEAGEILEAHVITSLSPSVKQLILIGDHKQLRPKVNNYNLTVEKGEGFDLNVSLFERLIRQGHRFAVLQEQFRSHPDISQFARLLAYPELKDVPKTHHYKPIRGLQKRVVFVHHEHPEEQLNNVSDRRDPTSKTSKKNTFEAEMVLKTVKYLSQQGYKSEDMVVLTPYMGQLSLLRQTLSEINDPYLNELDTHDLLRLSTVDNYQGEESDIVIISMARSNKNGDIGFLVACERLVVLMSRARKGIILYGNMNTFLASKKGGELWKKYFDAMKEKGFLFDGLPVHCEQHPTRLSLLQKPQDFDQHCPDGGCAESCGAVLGCGKHTCERRCHRLTDHSQVPCTKMMKKTCERGHNIKYLCGKENQGCKSCAKEDEEMRRRVQRDLDMEKKRQERQDRYQRDLQEMDDEIDHHRRIMKYEQEEADQAKELAEKKSHLESLRQTKARIEASKAAASKQKNASDKEQKKSQQKQPSTNYADLDLPAQEWEDMKRDDGARNDALDDLMGLIGLESVKREFLSIKTDVDIKIRQGVALSDTRLSCSLLGNPGTGKTTVARIWGKFLTGIGAIPGDCFKETTGSKLANMGVKGCEDLLEQIKEDGGGVLFIDEAYQLSSGNSPGGKAVLDYLLAEVENLRGKVVFVLAGYSKQMESFFAHNPGFPSRFPITMNFEDYTDEELLRILKRQVNRKYNNQMEIEDGPDGLYFRIAARRVGRGRGKEGFGNARSIENCLARIEKRQANRIRLERRAKKSPNDFLFTKEDIIGPEPSLSLQSCKAWKKMNEMIGLKEVKEQVKILLDSLTTNYERELAEEPPMEFTLNRVFLGSPGTGKTTVAKLYGEILGTLGLLSNGELVIKTPADFIGSALGQSESQTKGILASTTGKVLVIDEAYGLYGGKGVTDPYKTSVVDTIVAEVQNVPGDDRCVILIGYQEQMEEMFQNVNPGLSRRFSVDTPFVFEDFDDDGLRQVLDLKLKASGFTTTGEGKTAALEVLIRERNRPHFGNGGAVINLLSKAKASYQKRYSARKIKKRNQLEAEDFDEDFDRSTRTETNVKQLFKDDVGREDIIQKLENIQSRVRQLKALGMDVKEEIPFNFLFRGPPGTGKTTTAKKMGKVYYDMGFLSNATVEERSATDLIGQYVGQTGPKVQEVLEKSLGRVLLIDEAYRLAGDGYAKEAIDELVGLITTPKYQGKLIIILAGYEHDINRLLAVNPGLTSRFPESIDFKPLEPDACFRLLAHLVRKRKTKISKRGKDLDMSCLENPSALFLSDCTTILAELSKSDGWASARDVEQLAKNVFQTVNLVLPSLKLEEKGVIQELNKMLQERQSRMNTSDSPVPMDEKEAQSSSAPLGPSRTRTSMQAQQSTTVDERNDIYESTEEANKEPELPDDQESRRVVRDAGVSDEVWEQLQKDQAKEARKKAEYRDLLEARKSAEAARKKIVQELLKEQELKEEGERLRLEEAKKKAEAAREKILRQLIEQEERRKKEVAKQAKIRALGICPAGFNWIKQNGGYRCSAGGHFLSDAEIDKHMQ
ncbi:ATPase family associated with various cellular activities (AAA) domain-containing protein [Trichoderma breve]|uniref:ATPase family associated with various cellular activities (AAA) domain-containing protein n=1 Tax=Trichoderma breve TaxID=2034170 RepID=A0A9W9B7Y1_9HYPO|nr:ATPase family associated with various cellular activities (AAA) domain-containing protein [Trichoderma breve]KAJ4858252.1 ATPase family associated with various cellular activities (AAA) domain-containing protein [Trichoderma breve]